MDDRHLDALARVIAAGSNRRVILGLLAAVIGAGGALTTDSISWSKRKKKKKKQCKPACAEGQTCDQLTRRCVCNDGGLECGGGCCSAGTVCRDGQCAMLSPSPTSLPAETPTVTATAMPTITPTEEMAPPPPPPPPPPSAATSTPIPTEPGTATPVPSPTPTRTPAPTPTPGGRTCTFVPTGDQSGDGETLRALVEDPNGPATIVLCSGTYRATREIRIQRDVTIELANPGDGDVVVRGGWNGQYLGGGYRVFAIGGGTSTPRVRLSGLTIRDGYDAAGGGCILNGAGATLTLTDVVVVSCAGYSGGGCIYNAGAASLTDVSITKCDTMQFSNTGGSGIANVGNGATLSVTRGSITDSGSGKGGGLANYDGAVATVTGCTIANNVGDGGGGVWNAGTVTLEDVIISDCKSLNGGSGGITNTGSATLSNVTIHKCDAGYSRGGGFANIGASATLTYTNGTISESTAWYYAGGLYNEMGQARLTNVSVSACYSSQGSGGTGIDNWSGQIVFDGGTVTGCYRRSTTDRDHCIVSLGANALVTLRNGALIAYNQRGPAGVTIGTCDGCALPKICSNPNGVNDCLAYFMQLNPGVCSANC